jgi:hypothetical protein
MEIDKIKDDSKIYREMNLDRRGPNQIGTDWHIPDPPTFSLLTTFKVPVKNIEMYYIFWKVALGWGLDFGKAF